jgi:hypothetical protein
MLKVTMAVTPANASDRVTDCVNLIDTSDERAAATPRQMIARRGRI